MTSTETVRQLIKTGEDNGTLPADWQGEVKMVLVLRRKPGLTWDEFNTYWEVTHAPIVKASAAAMGIKRYIQTPAYQHPLIDQFKLFRGWTEQIDGIAELWWSSVEEMKQSINSPEGVAASTLLAADEAKFLELETVVCYLAPERVII